MEENSIIDHQEGNQEAEYDSTNDLGEDVLTLEEEKALDEEFSQDLPEDSGLDESPEESQNQAAITEEKIAPDQQILAELNADDLVQFYQADIREDERSNIRNHLLQDHQYAHAFNMATNDDYVLSFIEKHDPRAAHIMSFGTDDQKQELAQQILSMKQSYADQAIQLENQNIQNIRENYVVGKLQEMRNHYWQQGISTDPQIKDAMASIQESIFERIIENYPNANSPQHQQIFNNALSEACINLCEKLQISPAELAAALAGTFVKSTNKVSDVHERDRAYEIDKDFAQKAKNIQKAQTRAQSLTRTNGNRIDSSSLESFINMSDEELLSLSRNNPAKYAQFEKLLMNQG